MYAVRRFAVRQSRFFEGFYLAFERVIVALDPVFRRIGYERLEAPFAVVEKHVKGLLFDCKMCGQCVLSSTGMSCPMNCPKNLRNGPCSGVRPGDYCEVDPDMKCVWVDALRGAARMKYGIHKIAVVQPPVDQSLQGSSAWLRIAREKASAGRGEQRAAPDPGKRQIAEAFDQARKLEPASAPLAAEPQAAVHPPTAPGQLRTFAIPATAAD